MAVTVPATDVVNYQIQAQIAVLQALVTSNAANGQNAAQFSGAAAALEAQLVMNLLNNNLMGGGAGSDGGGAIPSRLSAHSILANCTINT